MIWHITKKKNYVQMHKTFLLQLNLFVTSDDTSEVFVRNTHKKGEQALSKWIQTNFRAC